MSLIRYTAAILLALAATLWLSSCQEPAKPLRISLNAWPGYEFIYLADRLDYFTEEGVAVEIVDLMSNGDVNRAYQRGHLDIGTATTPDIITITQSSERTPSIFYVCDFSNGADVIMTSTDNPDFTSLAGKRIGADTLALDMVHLLAALENQNMSRDDITIVPMKQTDMASAITKDEVDAIVTYPPVSTELLATGNYHVVFDTSRIPGAIVDVLITEPELIETRGPELAAVVRAYDRAVKFWQTNPERALTIMAEHAGTSAAELADNLSGLKMLTLSDQADLLKVDCPVYDSIKAAAAMHGLDPNAIVTPSAVDRRVVDLATQGR